MKADVQKLAWTTRQTELELPEEISLQLEVANVGSRTLAILVDIGLCGMVLLVVYWTTDLVRRNLANDWLAQISSSALEILLMLVIFGSQWIYFNLFEWLWNGQTPGKRLLRLRVIKMDGTPISWIDVLLRNVSRPFDTFPMAPIGLLMIFTTQKAQRLGDFLAQTLVIHETPIDWSIFDQLDAEGEMTQTLKPLAQIRLTPAQWELLHRYLNRREQLNAEIRASVAQSLYDTLKASVQGTDLERSSLAPEPWLIELARRT